MEAETSKERSRSWRMAGACPFQFPLKCSLCETSSANVISSIRLISSSVSEDFLRCQRELNVLGYVLTLLIEDATQLDHYLMMHGVWRHFQKYFIR